MFSLIFNYIIKRNIFKYTFFLVIASLFHTLIIPMFMFYWWLNNKINIKKIMLLLMISLGIIILLKSNIMIIGNLFSKNLRYYQYFLGVFNKVRFNILNFFEVYIPFVVLAILDNKYGLRKID
ncbi:EpsG family protein [Fusobacterium varium]|uniref:EpsG family protein n=1 Tax=Fusobacterium varium TaxID=856 RepID=UPI003C6CDC58